MKYAHGTALTCLLVSLSPEVAGGFLFHPSRISAAGSPIDAGARPHPRSAGGRNNSRARTVRSAASDVFPNPDPERSRRDLLRAALAVPAAALALASPAARSSGGGAVKASSTPGLTVTPLPSVGAALDLIDNSCNRRFLHAVVASDYNFLYRGLPSVGADARSPTIRTEPYDLLDASTYGSEEAVAHFRDLDGRMRSTGSPVLPSNGHLAVTCPKAAAEWGGVAASVWPLGEDDVHFAWYESGGEFWPRPTGAAGNIIVDGIDCGRLSLDDALAGDRWEVLFRADRGFLAVPVAFEEELREGLRGSFLV